MRKYRPYKRKRPNKLKAVKTVVNDITFDSRSEARYYQYLLTLQAKGLVTGIKMQVKYMLQEAYEIDGEKRRAITYTPDFIVTCADGTEKVIDVKGSLEAISRDFPVKKKLFEERYQQKLYVYLFSPIDGGWVEADVIKQNQRRRNKAKQDASRAYEESKRHLL